MKDYDNAFLGIILAGVLMLVIGLSLLIRPGPAPDGTDSATTRKRSIGPLVQNDPLMRNIGMWRTSGRDILFDSRLDS